MKVSARKLDKLHDVEKCLERLTSFLTPALPFINAHNVDYFVKSYWDQYLPQRIRTDAEQGRDNCTTLKLHMDNLCSGEWRKSDNVSGNDIPFQNCNLEDLVHTLGEFGLKAMKMSVTLEEIPLLTSDTPSIHIDLGVEEGDLKFDQIMSPKKMHEVEAMSYLIHRAAKVADRSSITTEDDVNSCVTHKDTVKNLIDFGSGKGYMSSFLAFLYDYKVLALDASPGNTSASHERSEKLSKYWYHLLRRAAERAKTGECISSRSKLRKENKHNVVAEDESSENNNFVAIQPSKEKAEIYKNLTNLNRIVHSAMDLDELFRHRDVNTNMIDDAHTEFGIVGLHTCGDLGVDSINLFLQHDNALFLCNVPCCYHHLEEMIFPTSVSEVNSPYSRSRQKRSTNNWTVEEPVATQTTFPLSSFLQHKQFNLGRNARMLSSYSHQRIREELDEKHGVDLHLIWRLLLQVIINEKLGHTVLEHQVGKIAKRCSNFEEYVREAMKKLQLEHIQVTNEEINDTFRRYEPQFQHFQFYYGIRTMLAPLLEACILLDRLAYLLEQEEIRDAYIVEVFNELMSPRRHAILAFKIPSDRQHLI